MTPGTQRIAIAEACGWIKAEGYDLWLAPSPGGLATRHAREMPDYLSDLNAMHAAESTLDDGVLWRGYLNRLWYVVCPQYPQMSGLNAAIGLLLVHATAAQRAEAFLRTLKLWKD